MSPLSKSRILYLSLAAAALASFIAAMPADSLPKPWPGLLGALNAALSAAAALARVQMDTDRSARKKAKP